MTTNESNTNGTFTVLQTNNVPEFCSQNELWSLWKEKLEIHFCEINCTEDNQRKAILLKSIGASAYSVLHSICNPKLPVDKSYKELCTILETQYMPPTIIFRERKRFYEAIMLQSESVAEWYARTKKMAIECKFGAELDMFVRDRFVVGLTENLFQKFCEYDEKLTLEDAFKKALIFEMKYANKMVPDNEINFVKNHKQPTEKTTWRNQKTKMECKHCGWRNHQSSQCRYKSSKCHTCGRTGHLSSVCYSNSNNKKINFVSKTFNLEKNDNNFDFNVYSITNKLDEANMYYVTVILNGVELQIGCDTGAPCNLLPLHIYKKLNFKVSLQNCNMNFVDYGGNKIKIIGEIEEIIQFQNMQRKVKFIVTDTENPPLLGRSFLRAFSFELRPVYHIREYSDVENQIKNQYCQIFSGKLGAFKPHTISLPMSKNVQPIFFKPRPVPFAWKNKIESNLRELIANDVLEPIEHAQWGTPIVPILKPNGDIRICGDFKVTLNKFLSDFKYPLPRIDEIFTALQGGDLFTKLDMSNAYNQLILDEKAQKLCTLSTHIGALKMKRLPFGITPASAIFQKTMENLLSGIPYVVVYQDDITVSGKDFKNHLENLKAVLDKLKISGLTLNSDKCEFFKSKISFLGFTIDKNGLNKNHDRTKSVLNSPTPTNISELRAFIGMANYYSKFIHNFASKMSSLYKLLQKNIPFKWSKDCQFAFENIKREISSDQVLVHYNPELPLILTTDASNKGVAGILSHKFSNNVIRPIAFVSRSLSKAEINYSTLEKEALGIIFSVTKLKQYLLGNKFTLKTDHKPLISIFAENKGIPMMAAARIQRWAFILSGFNYEIEHIKGVSNEADHLSRISQAESYLNESNLGTYINFIKDTNEINLNFKNITTETRRDPILSKVCDAVKKGTVSNLEGLEFKAFQSKSNELTVDNECLLWGYRVVVPKKLTQKVLQSLHASHLGIVKTKALARSYVWWPKIDNDIEKLITGCKPCQELMNNPEKSLLIPWAPETTCWSRIHIDFAGPIDGHYLLVVVDSFSKWIEIFQTKTITSSFVIIKLRELFSRFGLVNTIVSDNGRQFTSDEFKSFTHLNRIKHIYTAPGHPATNGQVEVCMKIIKKSLYANLHKGTKVDFHLVLHRFLMDYRNTIHCTTKESPAKLFLGRSIKTRFDLLKPPSIVDNITASQEKSVSQCKGKRNVEFDKGQKVLLRDYTNPNKPSWSEAKIENKIGPRTYNCMLLHNNREIKRHLDQIRTADTSMNADMDDNNNAHTTDNNGYSSTVVDPQEGEGGNTEIEVQPVINLSENKKKKQNETNISEYRAKLRPRNVTNEN